MPSSFALPLNNVVAVVGPAGSTAGSTTLTLAAGQGGRFPALGGLQFYRLTVVQQAYAYDPLADAARYTIYKATGRSGDTFTGLVAIEGTTDRSYVGGDVVDVRVTGGSLDDIHTAINALETRNAALCQGRLTTQSGDPTGITAPPGVGPSATLYFTPFHGNLIALYNGSTGWDTIPFAETAIAVTTAGADRLLDVFAYNNGGVLGLAFSVPWSILGGGTGSPGVRGEALAFQDGIYVRASDHTRRYLGTIYATSSGVTADVPGATGSTGQRLVWNYANRIPKRTYTQQGGNWSYGAATWRAFNNGAGSLSHVVLVTGIAESYTALNCRLSCSAGVSSFVETAIGFDNTAGPMPGSDFSWTGFNSVNGVISVDADCETPAVIGVHFYYGLEIVTQGPPVTVYGGGVGTYIKATHWC
jgi:hypothetical protein